MLKITILNFSGRNNGNCVAIKRYLINKCEHLNVYSYDVNNHFSPCGNCDYECLRPGVSCPNLSDNQREVMDVVCSSDLVYFIIPNYCGFPCANYYAFNERSVGYFNLDRSAMQRYMAVKKKFIVVSNTESEQFTQAMRQQTDDEPDILYLKTQKYGKRSIAGDLLDSEAARADLNAYLTRAISV